MYRPIENVVSYVKVFQMFAIAKMRIKYAVRQNIRDAIPTKRIKVNKLKPLEQTIVFRDNIPLKNSNLKLRHVEIKNTKGKTE